MKRPFVNNRVSLVLPLREVAQRVLLLMVAGMVALTGHLQASTSTWTGGGADANWTTSGNWSGTVPTASNNATLDFTGTTRTTATNTFATNTNFDGITFDSNSGTFTLTGATIDLTGNITDNSANSATIQLNVDLQGSTTITNSVASTNSLTLSGGISGTGPLTIVDANSVGTTGTALGITDLSGADTYTGSATLTGGKVLFDYGANSGAKLSSGSSLTLGGTSGGVLLTLTNTTATAATETVSNTVIANGNSVLLIGSTSSTLTLNLGTVTQTAGGSLLIPQGTNGVITANNSGSAGAIVGGFAIYTNAAQNPTTVDWAAYSGTGSHTTIGAYSGYTTTFTLGNNILLNAASTAPGSGVTFNTLKFANTTAGQTLTLSGSNTISAGGVLMQIYSAGADTDTIASGTITTANGADLNLFVSTGSDTLAISSNITGSIGVNVSPESYNTAGTVILSGSNSFTGNINVTRSTLNVGSGNALPSGVSGGTITLASGAYNNAAYPALLTDTQSSGTITIAATNYVITGNGGLTLSGTSTLVLTGSHTYTGPTSISGGGVLKTDTLANGGSASGIGASSNAASNLLFGGSQTSGALVYTGSGASTDRLLTLPGTAPSYMTSNYIYSSGSGSLTFSNTGTIVDSATSGTPQFGLSGSNTGNNTFDPVIVNGSETNGLIFNKQGVGLWILGGAEAYTGATAVAAGTLLLGPGGSLSSTTAVTVSAGATFGTSTSNTVAKTLLSTTNSLTLYTGTTTALQSNLQLNLYASGSSDTLKSGTLTISGSSGNILLTLTDSNGATLSGAYTLLTWMSGGLTNLNQVALAAGDPAGTLSFGSNSLIFTANGVNYYFTGSNSGTFTDAGNYYTAATGGVQQTSNPLSSASNVYLNANSASHQPDTLSTSQEINSLTFVTGGANGSLAGSGTLGLVAGVTDSATGGTTESINPSVQLYGAQTWTVSSSTNTLSIASAITDGSGTTNTLTLSGPGTFKFNSGSSTYAGGTSVTGTATLLLANSTGSSALGTGALSVAPGATIGGSGTANGLASISIGSGSSTKAQVIVGNGGTDTTSTLTLGTSGTGSITNANLTFDLSSTTLKQSNVLVINTGTSSPLAFSLTSPSTVTLNISGTNNGGIAVNTPYELIYDSNGFSGISTTGGSDALGSNADVITGGLSIATSTYFTAGGTYTGGYYNNSYLFLTNGGDQIDVMVVPEPSTWAMIIGGLAVLVFWQRRQRRQP